MFLSFKINKIVKKQNKVANYLNINYIQPFFDGKLPHWNVAPKRKLGTEKIVWQLWFQGIDENLPPLVRACFASVDKYMPDYKIVRLTKDTIFDYIDLPDFAYHKTGKGYKTAHFSDLLRVCLLAAYGGVWIDAKILLTAKPDENILQKDFFMFQRSKTPPEDEKMWVNYYAKYFSWRTDFKVKSLNSFIVCKKNYRLLEIIKDILLNFWKNENKVPHYFWFQIMFDVIAERKDCKPLNCEIINDIDVHRLEVALKYNWTQQEWNAICEKSFIHKLRFVKTYSENSFYQKILSLQ
ncbi:glycosyl transferase [Bacteroidia bacterium]|nr:glycosyl transferase [Bacteroidia bacterium]GHV44005.1 glycosyl transferase [Bacteroidia bacterium]